MFFKSKAPEKDKNAAANAAEVTETWVAKLHKPQTSLLVSLEDKTHNAEAILFDYRALGPALWDRFNGGADGTRRYYGELSSFFARTIPGGLSDRLSRAVQGFSD
jgi:hypothetical protein